MSSKPNHNPLSSGIRDNHFRGKLGEYLKESIQEVIDAIQSARELNAALAAILKLKPAASP